MSQFGGFDPGTFQAWALNLFNSVFVKAGIARGMQVVPTTPSASMAVNVTVDATAQDGVVFLSNGCWFRIDQQTQLTITSNATGQTRTDAVIITVDPTGVVAPSITVQANWASAFTPGTNQFVVALISVANGATSITSGNITMNTAVASVTAGAGGSTSMTASDGVGFNVTDNSATSQVFINTIGITTGEGRNVVIVATDASAIGHNFSHNTDGSFQVPGPIVGTSFTTGGNLNAAAVTATVVHAVSDSAVNAANAANAASATVATNASSATATVNLLAYDSSLSTRRNIRIFIGGTDPAGYTALNEGDIWLNI